MVQSSTGQSKDMGGRHVSIQCGSRADRFLTSLPAKCCLLLIPGTPPSCCLPASRPTSSVLKWLMKSVYSILQVSRCVVPQEAEEAEMDCC